MSLIKCKTDFILTWSLVCVITNSTDKKTFAITFTELLFLKIMQNCFNNQNVALKEQLT